MAVALLLTVGCVQPQSAEPKPADAAPEASGAADVPNIDAPVDAPADAQTLTTAPSPADAGPPEAPALPPADAGRPDAFEPSACAGPASQACGHCGTQTRTCAAGQWSSWSACGGEGPCAPGTTQPCGSGGTQSCGGDCKWSACGNQSCPGSSTQACGKCGTQSRTCDNATGTWSAWSACMGEGVCAPNTSQSCGSAGGSQSCGGDCRWGTCSCQGPTTQSCGCTGTQTRTCNDGTWSAWSACSGGADLSSDAQNCGTCGHRCTSGVCGGGTCACGTCTECHKCDGATGACVPNPGAACVVSHGGGACDGQGSCQARSCDPGFVLCAGVCTAESDHTCGPSCSDCYLPPGTAAPHIDVANCINHACKITQCNSEGPFCPTCPVIPDFGDCNNDWRDGCEVDLTTDANNCGDCGQSCSVCAPGSTQPWCLTCTTSPCTPCQKHPHAGGPNIGCGR